MAEIYSDCNTREINNHRLAASMTRSIEIAFGTYRLQYLIKKYIALLILTANGQTITALLDAAITGIRVLLITGYVQLDAAMADVVASRGGTVRIKCEITGYPLPRYVWYKDDVAVDSSAVADGSSRSTRFNVKTTPWGSRFTRHFFLFFIPLQISATFTSRLKT